MGEGCNMVGGGGQGPKVSKRLPYVGVASFKVQKWIS